MGSSIALTDPAAPLVADASAIINLVASGSAAAVIAALPARVVVVDVVPRELESGRPRGRPACDGLSALAADGVVEILGLPDEAAPWFEELVVGPAVDTLDDGEAATIAYALACAGTALIDERKATRICAERFPLLSVACTVDLLAHREVQQRLGMELLADAVFRALRDGRMGVPLRHLEWVLGLIGDERAALCESLPRRVRAASSMSRKLGETG
jgi:predicted nucleic acid-binding protein